MDRNDSVRGIDRVRADVLGLLLFAATAAAAAAVAAASHESKAAPAAGFGRLGQTLLGGCLCRSRGR